MSKPYKICPECGDHLDPGEICNCKEAPQATGNPSRAHTQRQSPERRYEICRECGKDWNVSRQAVIPKSGYLCPKCWSRSRT